MGQLKRRSWVGPRALAVAAVALAWVATGSKAQAPVDQFVIGVHQPGGWWGLDNANHDADTSLTSTDRDSLGVLGIDLLINTPFVEAPLQSEAPMSTQNFEETILSVFGGTGGHVVQWAPEGGNVPNHFSLLDYAGRFPSPLEPFRRAELGKKVDSLATKWSRAQYVNGFFGYYVGHENDPDVDAADTTGGIYDADTYPNLATVIDTIRAHDTARRIVAIGDPGHLFNVVGGDTIQVWTADEQAAFRDTFFLSDALAYPANILLAERYIPWCTSTVETGGTFSVQARIDTLIHTLDRAWAMVDTARHHGRKAEWYAELNAADQFQDDNSECDWQANPPEPLYRTPSAAELKAQAFLAMARGATGIVYYAYTSNPEELFEEPSSMWYRGIVKHAARGVDRAHRSPNWEVVAQVNAEIRTIGDTLYSLFSRDPLSLKERFTHTSIPPPATGGILDTVWKSGGGAVDPMEFALLRDAASDVDYLMVINRWDLYDGDGPQTVDLVLDA